MANGIQAGDMLPHEVLQELAEEIERGNRLFPPRLLRCTQDYANQHLQHLGEPTPSTLWEYIVDRLQLTGRWYYADLQDYPNRFGHEIIEANGSRLYIKLNYDNQSRVRVLSFHEGY